MSTPLKLFGNTEAQPHFIQDLNVFINLDTNFQKAIVQLYDEMESPNPSTAKVIPLIEKFKVTMNTFRTSFRLINFILVKLADQEITSSEILDDISKITTPQNYQKFKTFFESNVSDQIIKKAWTLIRIGWALDLGLPKFNSFSLMEDYRIIRDEKTFEEIKRIPVIVFGLRYEQEGEEKSKFVQITPDDFENFLAEARRQFEKMKQIIEKDRK